MEKNNEVCISITIHGTLIQHKSMNDVIEQGYATND